MGKSSNHSVFCKVIYTLYVFKSCIDVNAELVIGPIKFALSALKISVSVCLGFIKHNVNSRSFCKGGEYLICFVLSVIEGLFKVRDCNALSLDGAYLTPGLSVDSFLILGILLLRGCVGCRSSCLISKLSLLFGKVCGRVAVHNIGKCYSASAHIISRAVASVILSHVLTFCIGMYHCLSLRSVFFGSFGKSISRVIISLDIRTAL